ncbi:hypothetical protein Tsubulata_051590 [Turnera subulata]|uniref:Uncharacterized protein n=1 Tax=Turnera subulata TaxID=218843 RepID=A0A9Q0FHQ6_9ROSI|nr:hypothetical protein Tsubulata_051590 [Turnera subulata]
MGNCSFKGVTTEFQNTIRLLTDYGGIIELKGPKLAKDVLHEFPGYGIFREGHASSSPLSNQEYLIGGAFYYLLPLQQVPPSWDTNYTADGVNGQFFNNKEVVVKKKVDHQEWIGGHHDGTESPKMSTSTATDIVEDLANGPALEVLPRQGDGVWKVKLVINTKQLGEILSEEVNTEALIERMRMAAISSDSLTPRRSKSYWGVGWKPAISSVFKVPH